MQNSIPYTPQQNGVAERKNRYLMEMARCMLIEANMEKTFWGEAVVTNCELYSKYGTVTNNQRNSFRKMEW